MKRVVVWQRLDGVGLEYAEIASNPLRLEGDMVLIDGGEPCAVSYRVECDEAATTLRARVLLKRAGVSHECRLARSPGDRWTVNDAPMPGLDGLVDVDLSVTPSTNTPPIRRLALRIGQHAEVTAAWVRFPALDVVPLRQIYRRVGPCSYDYEAPDLHFAAPIECDDDGIVRTYGGLWRALLVALAVLALALAGCHAGSVCNPPGSTQGQIVATEDSASYSSRVAAQSGVGAPHMACKAEANIPITLQVMKHDTVDGNRLSHAYGRYDPRMISPPNNRDLATGEYRVLGVGRGIDRDDCGNTALQACNDAIDAYFKRQQANRPVGIVCRLSQNQDACPH